MTFLEVVGAVVVGLVILAVALLACTIVWGYVQAVGGFIRATRIGRRYGVTLYKAGRKPRFFSVRMIHWQTWHCRDWEFNGLIVPWTITRPVRRAQQLHSA